MSEAAAPPVAAAVAAAVATKELLSLPPTNRAQITVFSAPAASTLISQRIRERWGDGGGGGGGGASGRHPLILSLCLRSFKCEWDRNERRGPALSQVASLTLKPFWSQLNLTFMDGRSEGGRERCPDGERHDCKGLWATK